MKIIYMGTPDFAVPALERLHEAGHDIVLVVTQPDKARDRGKKIQAPAVKEKALELGLPVAQPERVKENPDFLEAVRALQPDLAVVAAYGKILPRQLLEIPRLGCINIHGSLLPKYRGAAPIQRSIIDGEKETGATLMYMAEGLDTGDMIAKVSTPIQRKTAEVLHEELAVLGAELLIQTLPKIEAGTNEREIQKEEEASYAPMIFKKDGELDFTQSAEALECRIRGLNSWPGAYTSYGDRMMKVWEADPVPGGNGLPGEIMEVSKEGIAVQTGDGILLIKKFQFPGKKAMTADEYLRGNSLEKGAILV